MDNRRIVDRRKAQPKDRVIHERQQAAIDALDAMLTAIHGPDRGIQLLGHYGNGTYREAE